MLKIASNLFRPNGLTNIEPIFQLNKLNKFYSTEINATAQAIDPSTVSTVTNTDSETDNLYKKIEIELKGHDPAVLKSYSWFATTAANHLGIQLGNSWAERKSRKHRMTLLKCVHIQKKHRVQYEIRSYYRFLEFHKLTGSTLSTFLEYIERNLPEGVALKTTKVEIQTIPEHLRKAPSV